MLCEYESGIETDRISFENCLTNTDGEACFATERCRESLHDGYTTICVISNHLSLGLYP